MKSSKQDPEHPPGNNPESSNPEHVDLRLTAPTYLKGALALAGAIGTMLIGFYLLRGDQTTHTIEDVTAPPKEFSRLTFTEEAPVAEPDEVLEEPGELIVMREEALVPQSVGADLFAELEEQLDATKEESYRHQIAAQELRSEVEKKNREVAAVEAKMQRSVRESQAHYQALETQVRSLERALSQAKEKQSEAENLLMHRYEDRELTETGFVKPVDQAIDRMRALQKRLEKAEAQAAASHSALVQQKIELNHAESSSNQFKQERNALQAEVQELGKATEEQQDLIARLRRALTQQKQEIQQMRQKQRELETKFQKFTGRYQQFYAAQPKRPSKRPSSPPRLQEERKVAALAPLQTPKQHVVQKGESLWSIARDHYGKSYQWPRIYEANRDVLDNQDKLKPGTQLVIP